MSVANPTQATVVLQFKAGLGAGGVGVADHFVGGYVAASDCSLVTSLSGATAISGFPTPGASGTAEQVLVGGLTANTKYCFAVAAADADGTTSTLATVAGSTGTAVSSNDIAAVRAAIAAASTTPVVVPSLPITSATVSYVKTSTGANTDGNGFVLQTDSGGPAIYVALDPANFFSSPALAPGDVVSLTAVEGGWFNCSSPCTADNSLYALTEITAVTRDAVAGGLVPAPLPLSTTDVVIPSGANWPLETVGVSGDVTLTGGFVPAGAGYTEAFGTTGGDPQATTISLRLPTKLLAQVGAASGCVVDIKGTPLWRDDTRTEISAWQPAELSIVSCPPLGFASSFPVGGDTGAPLTPTVQVGFTAPVDLSTVVPSAAGPCGSASITLTSQADPTTCIALPSFTADATGEILTATAPLATSLAPSTAYVLSLTTAIRATNGQALAAPVSVSFTTAPNNLGCSTVVISQVYGGGGKPGATYKNELIELHNNSPTAAASLSGCSVQYTSATGTGAWLYTVIGMGSIPPGGYFLIEEASAGAAGTAPPTPDFTGGQLNLSTTAGTVALSLTGTPFATGTCPAASPLVDLVGYGTATCDQTADAPAPSASSSIVRGSSGCAATGNNSVDFTVNTFATGIPPRNSSTAAAVCP